MASPSLNGHEITLLNLATHTSGLPRLPENLDLTTNRDNPYANYKAADLYSNLVIQTVRLASEPGVKYNYSNYGFGLLGHLLGLKAGMPYEELIEKTVCLPLGMTNTTIHLTKDQVAHLSPGHDPPGPDCPGHRTFDVLAGAGAFRSTGYTSTAELRDSQSAVAATLHPFPRRWRRRGNFISRNSRAASAWAGRSTNRWKNRCSTGTTAAPGVITVSSASTATTRWPWSSQSNYGDAAANDISVDKMGMTILKHAPKVSLE